jgi:hypothetical protein
MGVLVRPVRDRAADLGAFAAAMSRLGADAEPELARLVSERFELQHEHDVLLRTIARDLEAASVRPRASSPVPRAGRRWGWIAAAAIAIAITGVGVQITRTQADDAPGDPVSTDAVTAVPKAEAAPPPVAAAIPSDVPPSFSATPRADSVVNAPAPGEPARTRSRTRKKQRKPKKRQDGIFHNPYDKSQ